MTSRLAGSGTPMVANTVLKCRLIRTTSVVSGSVRRSDNVTQFGACLAHSLAPKRIGIAGVTLPINPARIRFGSFIYSDQCSISILNLGSYDVIVEKGRGTYTRIT